MLFEKTTRIDAPPSAVFAFHERPDALKQLIPPWEKAEVVEGGGSLAVGSRVVLKMALGPFSLKWVAEHIEYDPPRLFADRQVSGPFARWVHRHHFDDDGRGGTLLRDEVDYDPPMGALGRLLGGWFIERKLARMFDYRHRKTKEIVEAGRPGPDPSSS